MKNFLRFALICILLVSSVMVFKQVQKNNITLAAPPNSQIYVANDGESGGRVSIVDVGSNSVTATIPVGDSPINIKFTPDFSHAYVANRVTNNISVIDTATNTVTNTISLGVGDNFPVDMAINTTGTRLFTVNSGADANSLNIIDTSNNTVIITMPVGPVPSAVAAKPNSTLVYVAVNNTVDIVDTTTNTIVNTFPISVIPTHMLFNATGTRLYATPGDDRKVIVIDTTTNTETTKIIVSTVGGEPVFSSDGSSFYTTGPKCNVSTINTGTNKWTAVIPVFIQGGCDSIVLNPSNSRFYISNSGSGTLSVIDVSTGRFLALIPIGSTPLGLAVKP